MPHRHHQNCHHSLEYRDISIDDFIHYFPKDKRHNQIKRASGADLPFAQNTDDKQQKKIYERSSQRCKNKFTCIHTTLSPFFRTLSEVFPASNTPELCIYHSFFD